MHSVETQIQASHAEALVDESLRDLYQAVIVEHGRRPRHFSSLEDATHIKSGHNPLCGDQILLQCKIEHDTIVQASFAGQGCAICMASCSLMLERLQGMRLPAAKQLFAQFHGMLTEDSAADATEYADLGKLAVFQGVKEYPVRVKCATLGWQTLYALLCDDPNEVSTEG